MRIVQGISGALMTPTARLIVLEKTPASQLLKMVSYLIWPELIAPTIAPVVGGFIITYWSWHWIFLINIPIGLIILGVILGFMVFKHLKKVANPIIRKLGYRGALLSSFGMVFITSIALAFIKTNTLPIWIMFLALVSGVGRSLALTAYNGLSFSEIDPKDRNSANTLNAVVSTLAQGMGISLITVVVNLFQFFFLINTAYELGFIFLGLLMLFPVIEVLFLPKNIGHATIS